MTPSSTKNRLLVAAQAVIADEGWAAATTRRVAESAGVNPGLVHYHAGSIEELRREAMLEGVRAFFAGSLDGASTDASVGEWVRALIDFDPANRERARLARLLQESLVVAGRDIALRTSIAAMLTHHRAAVADALVARGVVDPQGTASTIIAIIDGALLQRILDPGLDLAPILVGIEALVAARQPDLE